MESCQDGGGDSSHVFKFWVISVPVLHYSLRITSTVSMQLTGSWKIMQYHPQYYAILYRLGKYNKMTIQNFVLPTPFVKGESPLWLLLYNILVKPWQTKTTNEKASVFDWIGQSRQTWPRMHSASTANHLTLQSIHATATERSSWRTSSAHGEMADRRRRRWCEKHCFICEMSF